MGENMIPAQEVMEVLEKIGNCYIIPKLLGDPTTDGDVKFKCGKWVIVVFMDGGGFDYIEVAISPDKRKAEFDDWQVEGEISAPECLLAAKDTQCYERMERIFEVVAGLRND